MNEEIKRIQEQWKKIGFVPRDKDKDIWNRYRKALDMYYKGITPEKEEEQSVSKADQKEKEPSISEPEPSEQ
jgi:hypothetical protein